MIYAALLFIVVAVIAFLVSKQLDQRNIQVNPYSIPRYPKWVNYELLYQTEFEHKVYCLLHTEMGWSFSLLHDRETMVLDLSSTEAEYIMRNLPEYLMEQLL